MGVHSTLLIAQVLGIVMISTILLKTLSGIMILTMMDLSTGKITSTLIIMKSYRLNVILTMMELLILVKSTNVLLMLKTIGEMLTAQNLNTSIVTVHTEHIDLIILDRKLHEN